MRQQQTHEDESAAEHVHNGNRVDVDNMEGDVVKMMRESRDADVKSAANTFYFLSGESLWRAFPPSL